LSSLSSINQLLMLYRSQLKSQPYGTIFHSASTSSSHQEHFNTKHPQKAPPGSSLHIALSRPPCPRHYCAVRTYTCYLYNGPLSPLSIQASLDPDESMPNTTDPSSR